MNLEIVPLGEKHLEDAAALASSRYKELCEEIPLLPSRYAEISALLPLLHKIVEKGPGVAAICRGRLVGFLTGWLIPSFRGRQAVSSPEWGNAVDRENSRRICEEMYTHISALWVADGYLTHLIGTLADDNDGIEVWHWLGFGMIAVDALRSLNPAQGPSAKVAIRRGEPKDITEAMALIQALKHHSASAPTFLVQTEQRDQRYYEEWLANPDNVFWLAYNGAEAVAFMQHGPASMDTCTIIRDEKTTSIIGAFTEESLRNRGIASALLNRSLEWARGAGYERCAVDFEPMNPLATRFWLRNFKPVCYTLVRHVDKIGT
ncbi:MAG: GNAT family N-acetyltransferase [Phycisphaerae bacterium]|nr:GNAT family N-acetyltransferase [Phycisphaerae bacterium]